MVHGGGLPLFALGGGAYLFFFRWWRWCAVVGAYLFFVSVVHRAGLPLFSSGGVQRCAVLACFRWVGVPFSSLSASFRLSRASLIY